MLTKPKPARKSVSFHSNVGQAADLPDEIFKASVPRIKKSVLVLPFHLVLNLYAMFHYGLTENPFHTITKGFFNLVALQLVYGYIYATALIEKDGKTTKKKSDNVLLLVVSATAIASALGVVAFLGLILFGAPLSSHVKETFALAHHLSLIVLQPLLVCYKLNYSQFLTLFKVDKIYRLIFSNPVLSSSFFAIIGTWLGVIPIPLDWDRPWQQWPITLLCGGYAGAFFGAALSLMPFI